MAELNELSSEELFNSALTDEAPDVVEQTAADEGDQRARDEHGRFVAKTEEPEPKPETEQAKPVEAKDEAHVPSWRLKEIREERDALRQQNAELQRRFQASQPKPEPVAKPSIYDDEVAAIKANASEVVAPIEQKFASFIETVSRKDAIREHGQERVTEAFSALDQAAKAGDPQAVAIVQAVKQSMDPYGDIVNWYRGAEASRDPDAFFQRRLEEALKDEKFKGELLTKLQPVPEEKPNTVFKLPPSIGRVPPARSASDEVGDMSDSSLFAHAMR